MKARQAANPAFSPHWVDFGVTFLFIAPICDELQDSEPPTGTAIPEVNIRQRDAPSGGFWLCVLFSSRKSTTFRELQKPPRTYQGRADV
ncbi:hypothetical protein DTW90_13350 [Neorhizobium sp. P12A]|nr:hypothetical protein DTW90_13350 [Neorhizobium sp. P12A]